MSRDPVMYLEDILQAAGWIEEYVAGVDFDGFCNDHMRVNGRSSACAISLLTRTSPWTLT